MCCGIALMLAFGILVAVPNTVFIVRAPEIAHDVRPQFSFKDPQWHVKNDARSFVVWGMRFVSALLITMSIHQLLFTWADSNFRFRNKRSHRLFPRAAMDLHNDWRAIVGKPYLYKLPEKPKGSGPHDEKRAVRTRDVVFMAEFILAGVFLFVWPVGCFGFVAAYLIIVKFAHIVRPMFTPQSQSDEWSLTRNVSLAFFNYGVLLLLFACVHYGMARSYPNEFHSDYCPNESPTAAMYYSVVTMTTLGYGDMHPTGDWARTTAVVQTLIGIFMLVFVVQTYLSKSLADSRPTADGVRLRALRWAMTQIPRRSPYRRGWPRRPR